MSEDSDGPTSVDEDLTDEQKVITKGYSHAIGLADVCGQLRTFDTPTGRDPLGHLVNFLMTEFWDFGFSQIEIRKAFTDAVADMSRYAGGEERRS